MDITYLQQFFKTAYDNSCYADVIIMLASRICNTKHNLTNIGKALDLGFDKGYLDINPKDYTDYKRAFTVNDAGAWLTALTGKRCTVTHEHRDYKCKKGEYEILFYAKSEADGVKGIGHFVLPDYDPVKLSHTAQTGFVFSKRIVRFV